MKVAFDMTPALLSPSGVGRYPRELVRALRRASPHQVLTVGARHSTSGALPARIASGIVREAAWYPFGLEAVARRRGADVVHCPGPFPVRARRTPLVITVHDLLPLSDPHLFTRTMRAHMRLSTPSLRRADRVLTGSSHTREQLVALAGVDPERIEVTPYGVDPRFRPDDDAALAVRERFHIPGPYVLCVATLEPRKNLVAALRAFRPIVQELPEASLVIAGGAGWRHEQFEAELGAGADRVLVAGYVSDIELVGLYGGASCFLFPSLSEGFGFPVLEAMACGAPVVSSNRTSLPEVAGDAAVLVDPDDVDAISRAVMRVLSEPDFARDLRGRGLAQSARFSWDACARATSDVYERVLAQGR